MLVVIFQSRLQRLPLKYNSLPCHSPLQFCARRVTFQPCADMLCPIVEQSRYKMLICAHPGVRSLLSAPQNRRNATATSRVEIPQRPIRVGEIAGIEHLDTGVVVPLNGVSVLAQPALAASAGGSNQIPRW